jgi:hypothetical protein
MRTVALGVLQVEVANDDDHRNAPIGARQTFEARARGEK